MGHGLKVRWIDARADSANVVEFKMTRKRSFLFFKKNAMCHADITPEHHSAVSVRLRDGENPTPVVVDDRPYFIPLGYVEFLTDSANIFFVRHGFEVFRRNASSISAKMIEFKAIRKWAESLLPKPNMTKVKPAASMYPRVTVLAMNRQLPAACIWVLFVINSLCVSGVEVQPRKPSNIPVFCERRDGRLPTAPAKAQTARVRVGQVAGHGPLVVIFDKSRVASGDQLPQFVGPFCYPNLAIASALANSRWIGSARIAGRYRILACFQTRPVSAKVTQEFSGDLIRTSRTFRAGNEIAASAQAKTAWIRRFGDRLLFRRAGRRPVVSVDESTASISAASLKGRQFSPTSTLTKRQVASHVLQFSGFDGLIDRAWRTNAVPLSLMTPVHQEFFEDGKGDCLRACVASILDLPLADVPNFTVTGDGHTVAAAREWLAAHGHKTLSLRFRSSECLARVYCGYSEDPLILMGYSPRVRPDGERTYHAVVGAPKGFGFRLIHDPHPSGAGLEGAPDELLCIM